MPKLAPEIRQRMIALHGEGKTLYQIEQEMGYTRTTIGRILAAEGVRDRSINHEALTDEQRDYLVSQYEAGYGLNYLVQQVGCSVATGREVLVKRGIEVRRRGPAPLAMALTPEQHDQAVSLYNEGLSREEIGRQMGTNARNVHHALRRRGIEPENRVGRGSKNHRWKGGRRVNTFGYVVVVAPPDFPFPEMLDKRGRVLEHRMVMALKLGRALAADEWVHHINGVKTENAPENLQLRKERHGRGQHFVCLDCGSHNVVAAELA